MKIAGSSKASTSHMIADPLSVSPPSLQAGQPSPVSETFIAFARTGNPNNRQIPRWEPYTLPRRKTLVFDVPSHLEDDPRGAERRLFAKVPYVQPGT